MDTSKVTRIEVIDHTMPLEAGGGRAYSNRFVQGEVEIQLQDDNRTLKVFIHKK